MTTSTTSRGATVRRPSSVDLSGVDGDILAGPLYRFHGFRVLDLNRRPVGSIDWIWANPQNGHGEFIGVRLQWLRGKARAIPVLGIRMDVEARTVQVPYPREDINLSLRHRIDRDLTAPEKRAIWAYFRRALTFDPSYGHARIYTKGYAA